VEAFKKEIRIYPTYYAITGACIQIMKKAIEKAGSLNREKIKKVLGTEELTCLVMPRVKYVSAKGYTNINKNPIVGVLQWQNGEFMDVFPKSIADAEFIYPMQRGR
jgi:ABC-type branched-subunit amino acid transport system substrate-binding protein